MEGERGAHTTTVRVVVTCATSKGMAMGGVGLGPGFGMGGGTTGEGGDRD